MKYYRSFQAGQTVIWSGDRMDFVASVVTEIAMLTQSMETVSRQMSALKRDGMVELEERRVITVPDFNRLVEETGGDVDGGPAGRTGFHA